MARFFGPSATFRASFLSPQNDKGWRVIRIGSKPVVLFINEKYYYAATIQLMIFIPAKPVLSKVEGAGIQPFDKPGFRIKACPELAEALSEAEGKAEWVRNDSLSNHLRKSIGSYFLFDNCCLLNLIKIITSGVPGLVEYINPLS